MRFFLEMLILFAAFEIIMLSQQEIEKAVLGVLKNKKGYVTLPYLAQVSGSAQEAVQDYVDSHPDKVRKSNMESENGESLYTLNTALSGLADAWASFRYVNSKKF